MHHSRLIASCLALTGFAACVSADDPADGILFEDDAKADGPSDLASWTIIANRFLFSDDIEMTITGLNGRGEKILDFSMRAIGNHVIPGGDPGSYRAHHWNTMAVTVEAPDHGFVEFHHDATRSYVEMPASSRDALATFSTRINYGVNVAGYLDCNAAGYGEMVGPVMKAIMCEIDGGSCADLMLQAQIGWECLQNHGRVPWDE